MKDLSTQSKPAIGPAKFQDPNVTAKGETRARVALSDPQTLWFNTGTLCNITCLNCYIESSPTNDALVYLTVSEVEDYLDQIETRKWGIREIGFTGGEPFMNPDVVPMLGACLERGYDVLMLTNAMRPMMRPKIQKELADLIQRFGDKLQFRVSLDHHSQSQHDQIRGKGSYDLTIKGLVWLQSQNAHLATAGRMLWNETAADARTGMAAFYQTHGLSIDAHDPSHCVLFPEMDADQDTPEITEACWGILDRSPTDVMCSNSRMVVKRKGAAKPSVVACTLLPYAKEFDLGETLEQAETDVALNHPHCSKFCVLGGASCSA